jgi:hypothetical protein
MVRNSVTRASAVRVLMQENEAAEKQIKTAKTKTNLFRRIKGI